MSEKTEIAWTDSTFNPWWGCQKVGPGCDHCYAETLDHRTGGAHWGPGAERRRTSVKNWNDPIRWNKKADAFFAEHGRRQRVFCASMADVFDNEVDPTWRNDLFDLIAATPNLDWLLLTKRVGNVKKMLPSDTSCDHAVGFAERFPNVWIGITITDQVEADRDITKLLAVPAAKRFLSMEPLLGSVKSSWIGGRSIQCGCGFGTRHNKPQQEFCTTCKQRIETGPTLDWVIVGGESGANARPMHPDWVRSLRDQCQAAGVPFFFKQWGEWLPGQNEMHAIGHKVAHHQDGSWGPTKTNPTPKNYASWDESGGMHFGPLIGKPLNFRVEAWAERVGKKAAGRRLDGREWNEFPS